MSIFSLPDAHVFATLDGLSGLPFWTAYHVDLTPVEQTQAQTELWFDAFYCGWSPGPDTWQPAPPPVVVEPPPWIPPPVVVVPPPWNGPPPPHIVCAPELSTWLMLTVGLGAIVLWRRFVPVRA